MTKATARKRSKKTPRPGATNTGPVRSGGHENGQARKKEARRLHIVIGCGRLGANLANTLSDEGGNVLIMDKNKDAFRKLSQSFGGLAVVGDGTDFDALSEAQIGEASVVVVVTNNDNTNVMIARLYDPERDYICREFGIDTICPAILSAKKIDGILSKPAAETDGTVLEFGEEAL